MQVQMKSWHYHSSGQLAYHPLQESPDNLHSCTGLCPKSDDNRARVQLKLRLSSSAGDAFWPDAHLQGFLVVAAAQAQEDALPGGV